MSNVDFQNGFLCGMATKGLTRSGNQYEPTIWNDEGVYTYFYIDFKRALSPFSVGMWNESIVVHDSVQLSVNMIERVSVGVYKVYCDIANRLRGITVLNKKTSLLSFATNEKLPVFSTHMYVAGITNYLSAGYMYDNAIFELSMKTFNEINEITFANSFSIDTVYESETFSFIMGNVTENASIVLI